MKTKFIKYLTITSIPFAFISCGGGGSSSTGTSGTTGYLGDGYIQGAYVCHDDNNNLTCLDDTYVTTNADGSFYLSGYDATKPLLAEIPIGAIDNGPFVNSTVVSKTFSKPLWYYLPSNSTNVFISPLSTAVHGIQKQNPNLTLLEAQNIIKVKLGEKENTSIDLMADFISGSNQNDKLHAIAEVLNLSMQNNIDVATATLSDEEKHWYSNAQIIDNLEQLSSSIPNDLTTFTAAALTTNTSFTSVGYASQSAGLLAFASLLYVPTDICTDLQTGYHALEEFNNSIGYQPEYKKMYLDNSNILQIKSRDYIASAWTDNDGGTSTHSTYLTDIDEHIIDMSIVNNTLGSDMQVQYDIPFPATRISCNGSSALFDSNGFQYRLFVTGLQLPLLPLSLYSDLGQKSSQLLTAPITFQSTDMAYVSAMLKVGDSFIVEKGTGINNIPYKYLVYKDISGPPFSLQVPNTDIVSNILNDDLIINYTDNLNYIKIERVNTTQVAVQEIVNGTQVNSTIFNYFIETYNSFDYLIVKNYQTLNEDLFIGRINSIDPSNMIYGIVYRSGTYGLVSHPGDMMDDMMLNKSAVDRLLLNNSYPINY